MSRKKDEDDENQENLMILRLPDKYAQVNCCCGGGGGGYVFVRDLYLIELRYLVIK